MTIKEFLTLRNIMTILCILMLVLLGQKGFRLHSKIETVREAGRLYAAGDLVAAEDQYRQAAANSSMPYKEELIAARLAELAPVTTIRNGLNTLALTIEDQLTVKDFNGFMESYAALLSLKSQYMKPGGPYEAYYRQLAADSGVSDRLGTGFRQFSAQFLAELAASQNGGSGEDSGSTGDGDSFKWNLLRIPDVYLGGTDAKEELLAAKFKTHDTARLKVLAAAGSFSPMLDYALSLADAYSSHSYTAPWVTVQIEESAQAILDKDVDGGQIAAFSAHAAAYRKYAAAAGLASSKVLSLIDSSAARLVRSAARLVRNGGYAEAVQLYEELAPLRDTAADIAAARLAWNLAEPVRLLPGGDTQGKYVQTVSVGGRFGSLIAVAGTDTGGRLYYADMSEDGLISTRTGDILPGFEQLDSLAFDDQLSAYSEVPVVVAEGSREDGRTSYTAYNIRPEGISLLFSFAGDSYGLQPEDGSIRVANADMGDSVDGQTAVYRQTDGVYQLSGIYQEFPLIHASELELHPFETVTLSISSYIDSTGRPVAEADGRYLALQGNVGSVTGPALATGQFRNGYDYAGTEAGEQYVPVFVVETIDSLSLVP
ncbi:hypothetical protein [Paenibacillus sp. S150]|uniref:hypothetical protein n=1 Tax=Paenibacillus sp. S150 TaxID=2749826 RepID=UPI001C5A0E41|nr:hypothetical protein [Paenibacillus sp. S150]MBW4082356.1 hypothetical protein [Paenibacillus sp. S150]